MYRTADAGVVEAVAKIAADRGVPRAQIALAWLSKHPAVTAPIVGATKPHHLDDAVASIDIELTAEEIGALESPYTPQPVQGFA
jgi:aryl-alcohol dehydrogenase (NADP+)